MIFKNRILPSSLFARSLLIIAVPILLLQLIVAIVFFDRHWDNISNKIVFGLSGEVKLLSDLLSQPDITDKDIASLRQSAAKNMHIHITVEDHDTAITLKPSDKSFQKFYWFRIGSKLQDSLERNLSKSFAIYPYDKEDWFEIVIQNTDTQTFRFAIPEKRLIGSATYVFILFLAGSGVILFSIALIFMRNQVRPLMRLALAAEKLGKGQDVPDFKPAGATEVRRAAHAFLEMKDRLKRQIEQRTTMLSGVSHDLRTPITRMKLQLAMGKQTTQNDLLRADVEEMEKMIEGYLAFARGEGDEASEMIDLKSVLNRLVSHLRRQGREVRENISQKSLMIKVRPIAIERALNNILSNAVKYGENIWIETKQDKDNLMIIVDDDGPGIPLDLREDVFKPFFRVDRSRNKKTGGVGLGLSIAQDIVHNHGGKIDIEDSPHRGLRVVITLPL